MIPEYKKAKDRKDYDTALRLLKPLAEQGDADAQAELGTMYENGEGVAQNYTEAWKWYCIAMTPCHPGAVEKRLNLLSKMTSGQRDEVDKNMAAWRRNNFKNNKPALAKRVTEITEKHIEILNRKHKLAIYEDDYGNIYHEKWDKEVDYFIDKVIMINPIFQNLLTHTLFGANFLEIIINIINYSVSDYRSSQLGSSASIDVNNLNVNK